MSKAFPSKAINQLYDAVLKIMERTKANAYQAVNVAMVQTYWGIGKLIVEEEQKGEGRAGYGEEIIRQLASKLQHEEKHLSERNLWYMRRFYQQWPKMNAVRSELSWTHYRILTRVENEQARQYYLSSAIEQNWSTRTLDRQISTQYYERVLSSNPTEVPEIPMKAEEQEKVQTTDIIKDPYVLEFLDIPSTEKLYEKDLEKALIDQLQTFLLELGRGFSFVGRQYRVSTDSDHFYIDLVFYNFILKCFVLVDLKTGKLNHQAIGQMDFYVRYFEDRVKLEGDNPTIGLILCAEKDNTVAKYSLLSESKQIFASK